jgi:threonine dehydratase
LSPACRVIGVEPAAGDDATRSFRTGQLQRIDDPHTVADGARTPSLGPLTFAIIMRNVADMTVVDDQVLLQTMFFLWERLKLVVEPTGTLAAAALLHGAVARGSQRIGVMLSGGNVDVREAAKWAARC